VMVTSMINAMSIQLKPKSMNAKDSHSMIASQCTSGRISTFVSDITLKFCSIEIAIALTDLKNAMDMSVSPMVRSVLLLDSLFRAIGQEILMNIAVLITNTCFFTDRIPAVYHGKKKSNL